MKSIIADLGIKIDKKARQLFRQSRVRLAALTEREQERGRRYIFHHIPKCGGTSAVDALSHWFVLIKDKPRVGVTRTLPQCTTGSVRTP